MNLEGKRILITGGLGFIGSNFIKLLLERYKKIKIINVDKKTYAANLKNLEGCDLRNYYWYQKDINNLNSLFKADIVVNFAAETHVDNSIKKSDDFIKTNICGTHHLLDLALKHKIKLFVQIGTDEVYGSIKKGFANEETKLNPGNPYSASKASADLLVLSYVNTYKLPTIITRSSNNYGLGQHKEKFIPTIIRSILKNKPIPVYSKGENIRDWIYVKDNCEGILKAIKKGKTGEVYNIAGGNLLSNNEIVRMFAKAMEKTYKKKYVKDRLGHDFRYAIDSTKIRKLGFLPQTFLINGIDKTWEYYLTNISSLIYPENS